MSKLGVAYKRLIDLEEQTTVPATGDRFIVADISDANKEKKISSSKFALTLLSVTSITDMSDADIQTLYTVPAGTTLILSHAILEVSGDAGANGVLTIGQGASANDFVGTTNVDNLNADGDCILMMPVPSATPATLKAYAAAAVISLDVATAANAVTGTLYLFGILY